LFQCDGFFEEFVGEMFRQIKKEARATATKSKRSTIRPIDIEKAVGIVLPEEMAVHCINFCQKSLNKYSAS